MRQSQPYRRAMASYLIPVPIQGLGGETSFIDSHLLDASGRLRDLDIVSEEIGNMSAQLALLDYELRLRMREPKTRGYPPRIFVSYRRESADHVSWCRELAGELEAAGYEVFLDAMAINDASPTPEMIARFIGQIAAADVALIVLTRSYQRGDDGESSMRQWLFEESLRIQALRDLGLLEIVAVAREPLLENPFIRVSKSLDALVDLSSQDPRDHGPVLEFFGAYRGPRYSADDQRRLARGVHECVTACRRPDRDRDAAQRALARIRGFEDTEEFRLAEVTWEAFFGSPSRALDLSAHARRLNPTLPTAAELAETLWLADLDRAAFGVMAEVAEGPSLWHFQFHHHMGEILAQSGFPLSALNQINYCLREPDHRGFVYERRLPPEIAEQGRDLAAHLEVAARASNEMTGQAAAGGLMLPASAVRTPDVTCESCGARYFSVGSACGICGTLRGAAREDCEMCQRREVAFRVPNLTFCPVCRSMWGEPRDDRRRAFLVPRGPKEQYSVLA